MKNMGSMIMVLMVSAGYVFATNYYVNSYVGNDDWNGNTPATAWKSLEKVNGMVLKPGDGVYLAAGSVFSGQLRPQGSGSEVEGVVRPIVLTRYGEGARPRIDAGGQYQSALYLYNVEYWQVSGLELTNTGVERKAMRCGMHIHLRDFGIAHQIQVRDLYVHDVNGSLVKKEGAGHGILWQNEGRNTPSRFDDLLIEGCHLVRCERNGIMGQGYTGRGQRWFASLKVVIRNNLLEEVPGDGIVPIGCDGALIEGNVMRKCTRLLPDGDAAAGIWPWACDNTLIQHNEVSDHKAPWDAQGFDSDWNCRGTIIQYNYSHDNEGGFLLVCCNGGASPDTAINSDTIVRYNISVNDGLRATGKDAGFSPIFHISGPVTNTRIYNNLIYVPKKPDARIDTTLVKMDNWGGPWPRETYFANNIFCVQDETDFEWGGSVNHVFEHNVYYGPYKNLPADANAIMKDPKFTGPIPVVALFDGFKESQRPWLRGFMLQADSPCIDGGKKITGVPDSLARQDFAGKALKNQPDIGVFEKQ